MDMCKIFVWVGIIVVFIMIVGIYGMNFYFMFELDFRWGYLIVIGGMVFICLFFYYVFCNRNWF